MAEEKWESGRAREMDRERDGEREREEEREKERERERERERETDGFPFNRPSIPSECNISFDPIPSSRKKSIPNYGLECLADRRRNRKFGDVNFVHALQ
jgi:hypothetical protein